MAYLLGAAAVMESLQTDVRDIQSCVLDIVSRVGPVHCTSWKFPDKQASDLDIEDLLDLYSYSDDEEERQVAHIALYELVIDRLVLLLHTMAQYTEGIVKTMKTDPDTAGVSGTSVGVVARKFWSRLSNLQLTVKHTVQEKSAMSRKVHEMEGEVSRLDTELRSAYNNTNNRPKTAGFHGLIPPNRAEMITGMSIDPSKLKEFGLLGRDEYNKACQTSETAFTPCDSCSMTQRSLRQSGDVVVAICQQQQIPSCLQKFRPQVSHLDWLTGNDVVRWAAEQNKDLQRISKLTATIKPLKEELSDCQEKTEKLERRVGNFDRDLKRERDDRTALHREYEKKIKEMNLQHTKTLELEQQQRDLLETSKHELERLLDTQKTELLEKKSLLETMESTKRQLEEELSSSKVDTGEVNRLQREMTCLQGQLDDVATKMDQSSRDLQREQAKNKSVAKHTQSLQSKQESLLVRIEVLDEENRELKDQLSEMEEEKEKVEESFEEFKRETTLKEKQIKEKQGVIDELSADRESLEQSVRTLETAVQGLNDRLEEARERERLIVEYPDINGPVNPDLTGSGDILVDMERQVQANTIRIQLLETQNEGLRHSINKLRGAPGPQYQQSGDGERWATQRGQPQPLWNPETLNSNEPETIEEHYDEPEYSHMENMYNQSKHTDRKHGDQSTGNRGIWNQSYLNSKKDSASTGKAKSGVHTIEFDSTAVGQKTSPNKDRPPFGHRPKSGNVSKRTDAEFLVGKAISRPESAKRDTHSSSGKSRPTSGKSYMTPVNNSSISAYLQLKKQGKLNTYHNTGGHTTGEKSGRSQPPATRIPTDHLDTADREWVSKENFTCHNCDKMYSKQRDLDIHMSYCTG